MLLAPARRPRLRRRPVQHGLRRFLHLPDPALWPVAGARCLGDRHPCRRLDGPFRYAQSHLVFRLDWEGLGATVSDGAGFWALLLLQLVNGAAVSFSWSGAQTLIAQL